jgi:ectoine hydroxylase-related dioxygenase (phytanoyl-CoA dioxygenase family)
MASIDTLPEVRGFAPTASAEEVVDAIKLAGGCIIRNVLTPAETRQIEADIRPTLDADKAWPGEFFPKETRRAMGLLNKSPTFARAIVLNPLYQAVSDVFLKEKYWCWNGKEKLQNISHPQLHNTTAFSIGPGAKDQGLHRDDHCHLLYHPKLDKYPDNPAQAKRDTAIGFFVAGKKTTKENGATR